MFQYPRPSAQVETFIPGGGSLVGQTVSRGKVTRSWRVSFFSEERRRRVNRRRMSTILFFVRVNQVLVRLWARAMEAALCAVFVPLSG
jgi:hypothetical protein